LTVDYGRWKIGSSFHLLARGAPVPGRLIAAAMLIMEDLKSRLTSMRLSGAQRLAVGGGLMLREGER
jgi:hypothetical protein